MLSTLTENCCPVKVKPAPAVYVPAPENCVNTMLLVPITTLSVVCTQPVSPFCVPDIINKKSPPATSAVVSKSVARTITVALEYV